jgi:hypothetical protein
MRGAVASVKPKVTPEMTASMREIRHNRTKLPGLIRLVTAVTTTAASTDCGTW